MNRKQKHENTFPPLSLSLSTVRLLEPRTCATSSKLLRLAAPRIRNKQSAIVPNKNILNLLLALFINVLLIKRDECFRNALANGVNLRGVASALDADSHVDTGEATLAEKEDWFEGLEP